MQRLNECESTSGEIVAYFAVFYRKRCTPVSAV
nr:hypothetical protein [Klebsiella pneumoniae]